ncbi:putative angiotensin-converting enzyme 2 [Helianthus debilis subsp. tardiflorus]
MSGGEVRNVSPGDIQMVQNLIEQCLPYYMTQKQVIDIIYQQEKIEPSFTELVWQKLEEQNQEFFKGYHLRLMVKDQIMEFNKLLDRQAALMQQLGPTGVNFQPQSNGSHLPPMRQNSTCYAPENTSIPLKTENISTFSRGFDNCGLPIPSGDLQPHSRRINAPPNMLLAHNSNAGITNGVSVKTESNYLGNNNSRFMYGTNGNVLEAQPAIGDASASSFSCLESDPHQLNGSLLNDGSLYGLLGPMPQNYGLSDSTPDFTNSSDMLENFSRSAFLSSDRDSFLDSHSSTVEHQENKRLDIPENLSFDDFGSES